MGVGNIIKMESTKMGNIKKKGYRCKISIPNDFPEIYCLYKAKVLNEEQAAMKLDIPKEIFRYIVNDLENCNQLPEETDKSIYLC